MKSCTICMLVILTSICALHQAKAQNTLNKKDQLLTGGLNLEYSQASRFNRLNIGISLNWQYLISENWALGLGLDLGKMAESIQLFTGEAEFHEIMTISPTFSASRLYFMNNRLFFALTQQLSYSKNSNFNFIGYNLNTGVHYKVQSQWLVSASTTVLNLYYQKSTLPDANSIFSVRVIPSLSSLAPRFSLSYIF